MKNLSENPVITDKPATPSKTKLIDSLWTFIIATAVLGPFSLPLLWRNPRFKRSTKVFGTVAVIVFTLILIFGAGSYLDKLLTEYKQILEQSK